MESARSYFVVAALSASKVTSFCARRIPKPLFAPTISEWDGPVSCPTVEAEHVFDLQLPLTVG
jgi:hypothetical protein